MTVPAYACLAHSIFIYHLLSDADSVRWLNHAVDKIWPICMEKITLQLLWPYGPSYCGSWTSSNLERLYNFLLGNLDPYH